MKQLSHKGSKAMNSHTVDLRFVSGVEPNSKVPQVAMRENLLHRFAIIQDTFVEGLEDMVFNESLWKDLILLLQKIESSASILVATEIERAGKEEWNINEFLAKWECIPIENKSPPGLILARQDETVVALIITEYWNRVGGPFPYSDSYTYSFFYSRDIGTDILDFLSNSKNASEWSFPSHIINAKG